MDNTISVEQIKAARALLGWNQDDLSEASSLSKPALANLERKTSNPRIDTLRHIQSALEEGGVEFTDGYGVKLSKNNLKVNVFKGKSSIFQLWNDIYDTLSPGEERLALGVSRRMFKKLNSGKNKVITKKFSQKGIKARVIVSDNEEGAYGEGQEFRHTDRNLRIPVYIYGNKYAIVIVEPIPQIVIIDNKLVADSYRKIFENIWATSSPTTKS